MKNKGKYFNIWVVLLSMFLLFGPFLKVEALAIGEFTIDSSYLDGSLNNTDIKDGTGTISLDDGVTPGNSNHEIYNTVTLDTGLETMVNGEKIVAFADIDLKGGNANSTIGKHGGSILFSAGNAIPLFGSSTNPNMNMSTWVDNNKYTIKTNSLTLQSGEGDKNDDSLIGGMVKANFYNLEVAGDINLTNKNAKSTVELRVNNYLKANALNIKYEKDFIISNESFDPVFKVYVEGDANKTFSLVGGLNIEASDVKTDYFNASFTLNKSKGLEIGDISANLSTTISLNNNMNVFTPRSNINILLNTDTSVESNIKDISLKINDLHGVIDFNIKGIGGTENINIKSINLEASEAGKDMTSMSYGNKVEAGITANTKITDNIKVFSEIKAVKTDGNISQANLTLTGDTEIGGNVLVEAALNPTLTLTAKQNAEATLTVDGQAKINGGNLTVKSVESTAVTGKISSAKAEFDDLDFSYSTNAVNINVIGLGSILTINNTLTLAGEQVNNINFTNANFTNSKLGTKLAVGHDGLSSAGTILNLKGTGVISSFADVDFYMYDALGGDTILTVGGSATDKLDLSALATTNYKFSLAGIGINPGEEIILVKADVTAGIFSTTNLAAANIITSTGLYADEDFSITWDSSGNLVLGLKSSAVRDDTGVIGTNTENLWFTGLDRDTNDVLGDNEWDSLIDEQAGHPSNKYYQQLNPNAQQMYYTLAYKNASGDPIYQWTNNGGGAEFRNNLEHYTVNILPTLVGGTITKDDLIVSLLNEMDPQVFVNSGAYVSNLVNKSFNQTLSKVSNNNEALAYWENIAAGGASDGYRIWAQTSMVWENLNDNGALKGYDSRFFGGYLGLDYQYDDFRIGVALGVGDSDIDWNNNTDMEAVSFMAKVYGEYTPDLWVFGLAVGGGISDFETERYIALNKHTADYNVSMFSADAYVGYKFSLLTAELMPKIGVSYLHSKQEDFTEKGFLSQKFNSVSNNSVLGFANVALKMPVQLESGTVLQPKIFVGVSHELADIDNRLGHNFSGSSVILNSEGNKKKRTSFEAGAGLQSNFTNNLNLSVDYETELQSNYNSHAVSLGLEYKF